jgi:hypothetical protein
MPLIIELLVLPDQIISVEMKFVWILSACFGNNLVNKQINMIASGIFLIK